MIILKLLALAIVLVALFQFFRVLLTNDPKYGRFNWKVAFAYAGFSTVLLVLGCVEFILAIPIKLYLHLQDRSSRGK